MLNNDYNSHSPACAFADKLVGVLYDEVSETEKRDFGLHLPECSECRLELTTFSAVRNGIGDWRETAFLPLDLPVFAIPQSKKTVSAASENQSWFARLRELFAAPNLRFQGATAFAVLAICAAIVFIFNFGLRSDNPIAGIQSAPQVEQIAGETSVSPIVSPKQTNDGLNVAIQKPSVVPEKTIVQLNPKPKIENTKIAVKKDAKLEAKDTNAASSRRNPVISGSKSANDTDDFDGLLPNEPEEYLPSLTDLLDEVTPTVE